MSDTILIIEQISKQYRLGQFGTGTLSHDLNRWFHRIRGKSDPYLKLSETNDRTTTSKSEYVWALKDVSFEVKQGEVVGIIGKNGAGKSTLLKILSRITSPTTGNIRFKGRLGALLEVGTGFHPELTGLENIYLNGAIMGMSKKDISMRLDEIVNFSGCERYLSTPVKRYSSGMIVRLGFSVAAHLEPEILIVDEVLAVGDLEFQARCLGKMKDVSASGRTVLFVSHNMGSISDLCTRAIMLKNGSVFKDGNTQEIIALYREAFKSVNYEVKSSTKEAYFVKISSDQNGNETKIQAQIQFNTIIKSLTCGFLIKDQWGQKIGTVINEIKPGQTGKPINLLVKIDHSILVNGTYYIDAALFISGSVNYDYIEDALSFELIRNIELLNNFENKNIGSVVLKTEWNID